MEVIRCAHCGQENPTGYHLDFVLRQAEVTPDWFISYEPNAEEYDAFFCSKDCILNYIGGAFSE